MDHIRPDTRVSDRERQAAADRLQQALGEGRLDLLEYDDRLSRAYTAVTHAELETLLADLPVTAAAAPPEKPPPAVAALPMALKVLWTVWFTAFVVNLTVWVLVSIGDPAYFWPMWLLVPGAALFAISAAVLSARRGRRR